MTKKLNPSDYPDMRKILDIINDAQGETPWNLDEIKDEGSVRHLIFVPNPKFDGDRGNQND